MVLTGPEDGTGSGVKVVYGGNPATARCRHGGAMCPANSRPCWAGHTESFLVRLTCEWPRGALGDDLWLKPTDEKR